VASPTPLPLPEGSLPPGERLGPYEIRGVLGSGGIGTVYRAWDGRLDREVALKVLGGAAAQAAASLADLEREARLLASVSHPSVLGIFDVGEERGRRWVATELLAGLNLRDRMANRPLPWRTAVAIVLEVAKGLAAAHARGVVHLDLKPENIFVLAQGGVKILDFGLARRQPELDADEADPAHEGQRAIRGTLAYLTPEQVSGEPVDHRADLFSLGSVLFELLTGRAPFRRDGLAATLRAIAHEDPPPLAVPGMTVPAGLARIVRRCLDKDPRRRFQTAFDLAFALSEQLAAAPAASHHAPASPVRLGWFVAGLAVGAGGCLLLLRLLGT